MEPTLGIEPKATYLPSRRSTTDLSRHVTESGTSCETDRFCSSQGHSVALTFGAYPVGTWMPG